MKNEEIRDCEEFLLINNSEHKRNESNNSEQLICSKDISFKNQKEERFLDSESDHCFSDTCSFVSNFLIKKIICLICIKRLQQKIILFAIVIAVLINF